MSHTHLSVYLNDHLAGGTAAPEALSLGIEGKHALWIGLASIAGEVPAFRSVDFERLQQRAQDQRRRVEPLRLGAVRAVLADSGAQEAVYAAIPRVTLNRSAALLL